MWVKPELAPIRYDGDDARLEQKSKMVCVEAVHGVAETLDSRDDVSSSCRQDVNVVLEGEFSVEKKS